MQCPKCSLYHPARYDRCVSCGSLLRADGELINQPGKTGDRSSYQTATEPAQRHGTSLDDDIEATNYPTSGHRATDQTSGHGEDASDRLDPEDARAASAVRGRHSAGDRHPGGQRKKRGLPTGIGVAIAGFILCASAGGTFFYLTKPPENERLLIEGQKQLSIGQFAFALKTLGEANRVKPNDARVLLALARAYIGVDQVDKAWDCIMQAQQLGSAVTSDPSLATDLAAYYRQHNQYQRAIELLRPLAEQIPGKKAELCDLDAAWGDEAMRNGNLLQALKCWEEVKVLHDGSRFAEADTRLASVYQKMAEDMATKGDDEEALKYFSRLNALAPSGASYERAAEIYQKRGNMALAIDQMEQAIKLSADPAASNRKLAQMMAARGKELIDTGEIDTGYGYLQKAQSLDPHTRVPTVTVRSAHLEFDKLSRQARFEGELWNPGPGTLGSVTVKGEFYDTKESRVLWSKDLRVVDEFVPPLLVHDSRPFEFVSSPVTGNLSAGEFRIYLNGSLYQSYPIKVRSPSKGSASGAAANTNTSSSGLETDNVKPHVSRWQRLTTTTPSTTPTKAPPLAPNIVPGEPTVAPPVAPSVTAPTPGPSSEEKTLKDLD